MTRDPNQNIDDPLESENQADPIAKNDNVWVIIIAAALIIYTSLFVGLAIYGS